LKLVSLKDWNAVEENEATKEILNPKKSQAQAKK
jgi:hypothetical protein